MATIYGENDVVVKIPFPEKKFQAYLKKLKVNKPEDLTPKQKQSVFITAIRDFKIGKLSLDEFSDMSGHIWQYTKDKGSELMQQLYHAGELNYYVRHIEDKNDTFVRFMKEVMDYYEKYKNRVLI